EEANVMNALTGIAALGLALITATFPNVRGPGLFEDVGEYAFPTPDPAYGYTSPYTQGGQCVEAADRFVEKFGGTPKYSDPAFVNHKWVEYEGQAFDPTLRGNLQTYGAQYQDIPEGQQWFSLQEHDQFMQRFPRWTVPNGGTLQ
ncbi:MAG TPA: hypothetical protein VF443_10035, partial [Nitrospira sp.]